MLRIEPRRCAPCLDPDGLHPSREQPAAARRDERAECAGGLTKAALPVAGDRGLAVGRRGYATAICLALPLDELARCSRTALRKLRSRALRPRQIFTPATRHARSRAA